MIELSRPHIGAGDIVVLAPEINAETLSLYFNGENIYDKDILKFITYVNQDGRGTGLEIKYEDEISGYTVCSGTVLRYKDGYVSLLCDCRFAVTQNNEQTPRGIQSGAVPHQ